MKTLRKRLLIGLIGLFFAIHDQLILTHGSVFAKNLSNSEVHSDIHFKAVISCSVAGSYTTVYACFTKGSRYAGGKFETIINGKHRSYTLQDLISEMNTTELVISLGHRFEIFAQANGSNVFLLQIVIVDRSGRISYQRQANSYGIIRLAN